MNQLESVMVLLTETSKNMEIGVMPEGIAISTIEKKTNLDYRTIRTLIKIIQKEDIGEEALYTLIDPAFYTMDNMVKAYKLGFEDIIPYKFYENEMFINKAKITKIPDGFLEGNSKVKHFNIDKNITYIGNNAFNGCSDLRINDMPNGLTYIGNNAFEGCSSIQFIMFPKNIRYIASGAFKNCTGLRHAMYPLSLTSIEDEVFAGCSSLEDITTNRTISAGVRAFEGCHLIKKFDCIFVNVGKEAFKDCISLEQINLATSVIEKRAFANCKSLETVTFNNYCPKEIKKDSFLGCNKLNEVRSNDYIYNLYSMKGYEEISKTMNIVFDAIQGYKTDCEIYTAKHLQKTLEDLLH